MPWGSTKLVLGFVFSHSWPGSCFLHVEQLYASGPVQNYLDKLLTLKEGVIVFKTRGYTFACSGLGRSQGAAMFKQDETATFGLKVHDAL